MSVFELLLIGHLIGDWLLQTSYQALNKDKGKFFNRALIGHSLVYTAVFIPILILQNISLAWLLLVMACHVIIDRRWPVVWTYKLINNVEKSPGESEAPFWLLIVKDQVIHILVLATIVLFST